MSGADTSQSIVMDGPKSVTANFDPLSGISVTTNPSGLQIQVDDSTYTDSRTFEWSAGSSHTISVVSPQEPEEGVRYIFSSWSDQGAQTHTITAPSSPTTYTANFTTQYLLTVNSERDDPQGGGWYDSGATAQWSVTSPADETDGTRYIADTDSGSVVMDGPKTVEVSWTTQYFLTVDSERDDPQGGGWYDSGVTAQWSVTSPADEVDGTRYIADIDSGLVVMDGPETVEVSWAAEHRLTTAVSPEGTGSITQSPSEEWLAAGTPVTLIATPNEDYVFSAWSGDLVGSTSPATFIMDGSKTVTAVFAGVPRISLSPFPTMSFGSVLVGEHTDLILTVSNQGTAALSVAVTTGDTIFTTSRDAFTVSARGSQPILVRFRPAESGTKIVELSIVHNDTVTGSPSTIVLSGKGVETSPPTLSPQPLAFGSVKVGQSKSLALTVNNPGISSVQVTGITSSDAAFTISPTQFTLPVDGNTTATVVFTPTDRNLKNATLTLAFVTGTDSATVTGTLTGQGTQPVIEVSPLSLEFGEVAIGETRNLTLTVSNTGNDTLLINSINITLPDASQFPLVTAQVPPLHTILPNGSQSISVPFTPLTPGNKSATLTLTHSNTPTGTSTAISLTGEGVQEGPIAQVIPLNVDFGELLIDSTRTETVLLINLTDLTLTGEAKIISLVFSLPTDPFRISVAAKDTFRIPVSARPPVEGEIRGQMEISFDGQEIKVALSVESVSGEPEIRVSSELLDFAQVRVGDIARKLLEVENVGGGTLRISDIQPTRLEFDVAQRDSLPIVLRAGETRSLQVSFSPDEQEFVRANIVLTSNDPERSTLPIQVQGEGVGPLLRAEIDTALIPSILRFDDLAPDERDTSEVLIRNTGDGVLFVYRIESSDRQVHTVPESLKVDPGQLARVQAFIQAAAGGDTVGTLQIRNNDPDRPVLTVPWRYAPRGGILDPELLPGEISFRPRFGRKRVEVSLPVRNLGRGLLAVELFSQDNQIVFRPGSVEVAPGALVTVRVRFQSVPGGEREGVFQLLTNDPDARTVNIPWSAPEELEVVSITPQDGTTGVSQEAEIAITFSEPLLSVKQFVAVEAELLPPAESGALLDSFQITGNGQRVVFPVQLNPNTAYRLIVSAATGASGAELGQVAVSGFTTGAAPVVFGSISGRVAFDDGRTFEGNVFVFNEAGDVIAQQAIEPGGEYTVSGLPAGNFQIFVDLFNEDLGQISAGYDADGDGRPDAVVLDAGQDVTGIDLLLSSTPSELPPGPGSGGAGITLKLSLPDAKSPSDTLYSVKAGQKILAWVEATGVVDLAAYQVAIAYDTTQVAFQRVDKNSQTEKRNILFREEGKALFISTPPVNGEVGLNGAILGSNPELFLDGDGLLGVFRFTALGDLTTAEFRVTRVIFKSGSVEETLTVDAVAAATSEDGGNGGDGPVKVDLDAQEGNQRQERKEGVNAGDPVILQLFAEGFSQVTGYGMFVSFDTTQVAFVEDRLNADFIPGAFERIFDTGGKLNVALVSLGGTQVSEADGFLGELEFTVKAGFADSTALVLDTVTLNLADGSTRELPQRTVIRLVGAATCGPDFNCNGTVEFQDFLLFAQAFGSTNLLFDLDGDGFVGFGDFVIFALAFGKPWP